MARIIFVILLFAAIDFYLYWVLKFLVRNYSKCVRHSWIATHTFLSLFFLASLAVVFTVNTVMPYDPSRRWTLLVLSLVQGVYISKVVAWLLFAADDVRRGAKKMKNIVRSAMQPKHHREVLENAIPRSAFLSWAGTAAGFTLLGFLLKGTSNRYKYQIRNLSLSFPHLPPAFHQFKIVQISDIHAGSFDDKEAVEKGVDLVLKQQADLIVFTGDLVNNRAAEMHDYIDVFKKIRAPFGVYSILGNHDYGDYVTWKSDDQKSANLQQLKQTHQQLGWRLLLNEHEPITKDGTSIALLGIENWGAGNFSRYGKMEDACRGTENYPFKILLSHDPSHWSEEVCSRYPDIDLTLSGHTHGLQFGVETPLVRWSPAQWFYKQWAGLYKENAQVLYVNRGFGFIGYQGRVGIMPEISVITLQRR